MYHLVFVMTCSTAVQVRHMFAQCITAMAHHQYLELEGGHKLVEFIVKQCALSDEEVRHIKISCFDVHLTQCKPFGTVM